MEDENLPIYMVNVFGAEDLATQGSRASATIILAWLNRDNSVSAH